MSYDEAIKRIEQLVLELEESNAISMDDYLSKAKEVKELIVFCQKELTSWEKKMESIVTPGELQ
ncbi:MAG: exodeoxyribonuclease VII small subunit [Paludibacteraceae bacterium]|nr:exodeoxyribonuclease VII small subunit [Paludibacteraceae bacterium]